MLMLKPCPFCGAYGTDVVTLKEEIYMFELQLRKVAYVKCIKCGGRAGYGNTEKEARQNWNTRTGCISNSEHKKSSYPSLMGE